MTAFTDTLYPCSFRGAPFIARDSEEEFGRKLAVHTYPQRDTVYPEDMGRKAREYEIEGFLVGDDVLAQRDYFISLVEQAGPGLLVHPTHGVLNVVLTRFKSKSPAERGRSIEMNMSFIEAGARIFPSTLTSAFGAITDAISDVFGASTAEFVSDAVDDIKEGASVVAAGAQAVGTWVAAGAGLAQGATNLLHMTSSISGSFGRFAGGSTGTAGNSITSISTSVGSLATQVNGLIAQGSAAQAGVAAAGNHLMSVLGGL